MGKDVSEGPPETKLDQNLSDEGPLFEDKNLKHLCIQNLSDWKLWLYYISSEMVVGGLQYTHMFGNSSSNCPECFSQFFSSFSSSD